MAKKRVKPSQNKAKNVETKRPVPQTSEELGLLLSQNYNQLLQIKANIQAINVELEKRQTANK